MPWRPSAPGPGGGGWRADSHVDRRLDTALKLAQVFYDWQTLIAGVLAFAAGFGTVVATMIIACRQIKAAREQTATTIRLEQDRIASEASAFRAMLEAAMARVLAEAAWAKETYPESLAQTAGSTVEALTVRQCITKGAFADLRGACVRRGSTLTSEFLALEREIDNFALQYEYYPSKTMGVLIRLGKHAGLRGQLTVIETKAAELRKKAFE
jgi:hypothetical protein